MRGKNMLLLMQQ